MRIGVIGTGVVGKTLAAKLVEVGHEVMVGTRDVSETLSRTAKDVAGKSSFADWHKEHPNVKLGTFAEAARHGEVVISATSGEASLEPLKLAGAANLKGKILMEISNPLDFSNGFPPGLTVARTDSNARRASRVCIRTPMLKARSNEPGANGIE